MFFLQVPLPKDIPLALPAPEWLLVILLVVSFIAHILFVNLMLGGSILTLWYQWRGKKNPAYDKLAHEIASTITVNKSMAVVMGVAPLLTINALYTIFFYTANSLTGLMWIAVIPLVSIAFLLTYLHKYTWEALAKHKNLHISIIALATLIFLFIPFIFLANTNLMLFPEKWGSIKGFLSALLLPNVFPRYLHFLLASLSATGLFLFWYLGRKSYPFEAHFSTLSRVGIKKQFYSLVLGASATQFLIGPIVLLTLPSKGLSWGLIGLITVGASLALPAMYWLYKGISSEAADIDKNFGKIVALLSITVLFMGSGRHLYRANSLDPHRKLMAQKTAEFQKASIDARNLPIVEALEIDESLGELAKGSALFQQNCAACHAKDTKVVGPPIVEMVSIYQNNPNALAEWIKKPGKKRPDYPQMPSFEGRISDEDIAELSKFIYATK